MGGVRTEGRGELGGLRGTGEDGKGKGSRG